MTRMDQRNPQSIEQERVNYEKYMEPRMKINIPQETVETTGQDSQAGSRETTRQRKNKSKNRRDRRIKLKKRLVEEGRYVPKRKRSINVEPPEGPQDEASQSLTCLSWRLETTGQ